jgi:hypothetical protein
MVVRRKFVVVDTRGTVPSDNPPCAIDRVRVLHDSDLAEMGESMGAWSAACVTGDVLKEDGLVYICAVMWMEE